MEDMLSHSDVSVGNEAEDDDTETSKLGVLVPEKVQDANRAVVEYCNDGSVRNKLGPGTTDRITHGLAMWFWRNPDKLDRIAHSEYVEEKEYIDDPQDYKDFIRQCQQRHLADTLVVAQRLLHGSFSGEDRSTDTDVFTGVHPEAVDQNSDSRPIPSADDDPQNRTIPDSAHELAVDDLAEDIEAMVDKRMREQAEVMQQQFRNKLEGIESELEELEQRLNES